MSWMILARDWLLRRRKASFLRGLIRTDPFPLGPFPISDGREKQFTILSNQYPIFKDLLDLKSSQMIKRDDVSPVTRCNGSEVIKPEIFRSYSALPSE